MTRLGTTQNPIGNPQPTLCLDGARPPGERVGRCSVRGLDYCHADASPRQRRRTEERLSCPVYSALATSAKGGSKCRGWLQRICCENRLITRSAGAAAVAQLIRRLRESSHEGREGRVVHFGEQMFCVKVRLVLLRAGERPAPLQTRASWEGGCRLKCRWHMWNGERRCREGLKKQRLRQRG